MPRQQTTTIKRRWLLPLVTLLLNFSGIAMLAWTVWDFSWVKLSFSLVHLIFPVYGLVLSHGHIVETRRLLYGLLSVLILSTLLLSIAHLQQWQAYACVILLTWLHVALVCTLTLYLSKISQHKIGLKVGQRLPGFVFEDTEGNPVTRSNIGEGPILFYFFRGNWCPFCSVQIQALIAEYKKILDEGILLAFVSAQPHSETQKLAAKHGLACRYLVDSGFKFSEQYDLVDRDAVPAPLSQYGSDTLLPTLLLVDQRNKILMLEQTDNVRFRPEPDIVLSRVKELGANAYLEEIIEQRTKELSLEKEKSEKIILNILPEHTAIELKEKGKTQARYYDCVTLLFSDFAGFTKIASGVEPQVLVDSLNAYFEQYDRIVDGLGLEKIKTIGDAYMVAGGLPVRDPDHALKCCELAIRMLEVGKKLRQNKHLCQFECRIGIHSGPVMAGVVGEKKFCYDIWGDTVNLASRLESNSEIGRINISATTYGLVKPMAQVEDRGLIAVKNHSQQQMYFLNTLEHPTAKQ